MKTTFKTKIRTSTSFRLWKLVLLTSVCLFGRATIVSASALTSSQITVTDNRTSGYITLKIPVYDDDGYDEYLRNGDDKSYVEIGVDGGAKIKVLYMKAGDQGDDPWYHADFKLVNGKCAEVWNNWTGKNCTYCLERWLNIKTTSFERADIKKSGSLTTAEIRYYLPNDWLGKRLDIYVYLDVCKNGGPAYPDYKIDNSFTLNGNNYYEAPTLSVALSQNNAGYQTISGTINSTTGSTNRYYDSGSLASTSFSGNNFSFQVPIQDDNRNETAAVRYLVADYCGEQSITKTASISVPGYPVPTGLNATYANGSVSLSWSMSSTNVTGDFAIQRSPNADFSGATTIISNLSISSRTHQDNVSDLNLNGTYYYRIHRTSDDAAGWGWAKSASNSVSISSTHRTVKSGSVTVTQTPAGGKNALIKWDYNEGIWSTGSKVMIDRINISTGGSKETIEAPADSVTKKQYTDQIPASCNAYKYEVYVKPGQTAYPAQTAVSSNKEVIWEENGEMDKSSLIASKGYFSDRVELAWRSSGNLEEFIIQRREYGTTEFTQLDTKKATASGTYYTYVDDRAIPGIIYEYSVGGVASCAGKTLSTTNVPTDVGFRTPTGDIYGRVAFESGQGEEGVTVSATTDDVIPMKSLSFASSATATIENTDLLKNNTSAVTLQAWIAPQTGSGIRKIISKNNMYELGINSAGNFYFKAGSAELITDSITAAKVTATSAFVHLSGVFNGSKLSIYINGILKATTTATVSITGNNNPVTLGGNYSGIIDEVRIWGVALDSVSIKNDHRRYLIGNEKNLLAYYTFDYVTNKEFFDISYTGSTYHQNHGKLNAATVSNSTPTNEQLGYRGITRSDGGYEIRAIPYTGNGTAYQLMPRLGIHTFESEREIRFLNAQAQSHTVNFTDKSSFRVKGRVLYSGGTVPANGVSFKIDGITVMNKGSMVLSGTGLDKDNTPLAPGEFEFYVPIGVHEVKAVKNFHVFENGGKITDPKGNDLNYQDEVINVELRDSTTIRYIGRIAGGTEQEAYPVGHSLSKNNLGDGVTLTLEWDEANGRLLGSPSNPAAADSIFKVAHFQSTHDRNFNIAPDSTTVTFNKAGTAIIISPSKKTGEFAVNIIPENGFTLKLNVPGYGSNYENKVIQGGNFANSIVEITESHEVEKDSVYSAELQKYKQLEPYTDFAPYHAKLNQSVRSTSSITVEQCVGNNIKHNTTPFFGLEKYVVSDLVGNTDTITLWNKTEGYIFKNTSTNEPYAIYSGGNSALYKISLFEAYPYYVLDGTRWVEDNKRLDKVPVQKAGIKIQNNFATAKDTTIVTDSLGLAAYYFVAGGIEPGNPVQRVDIVMAENPVVAWGLSAICIGDKAQGSDFVTNGPDEVLMVLRDPPGSQSYSYLESGFSVTRKSFYKGSIAQTGNEELVTYTGVTTLTMTGAPGAMTGGTIEAEDDAGFKLQHEEKYTGEDSEATSYTTKIKYSTSSDSDPLTIGADADLYIGNSTNLAFSRTTNLTFVKEEKYDPNLQQTKFQTNGWRLVQCEGLGIAKQFATSFAYSQRHIIDVLIPMLKEQRNNALGKYEYSVYKGYTNQQLQDLADTNNELVVVSLVDPSSDDYGLSNTNDTIPKYYRWFYPKNYTEKTKRIGSDTIKFFNQSIEKWEEQIRKNEQAKVYAIENRESFLVQNHSFQGGSNIEYAEQYSTTKEHTSTFEVTVDLKAFGWIETKVFGSGVTLKLEEGGATSHGGGVGSSAARSHEKGYVLADDGRLDYFSVDVLREPRWNDKTKSYEKWSRSDEVYEDDDYYEFIKNGGKPEDYQGGSGGMVDEKNVAEKSHFSTFIFYTQGGLTSCPYENEVVSKYYEPGRKILSQKTIQLEQPGIKIEPTTLVNVPSGETGKFKLTIYNNVPKDVYMEAELRIDNASTQRGATFYMDGAPIGNGRYFLIDAGETIIKTLEVGRGIDMDYVDMKLVLKSICDYTIADTATFSIHFTPSCTDVNLRKPTAQWVYNTKLDTLSPGGFPEHYMNITIDGFDQNYDNFHHIELQRKSASQSDMEWKPLMNFYADPALYKADSTSTGADYVSMIQEADRGSIYYKLFMDELSDQRYDIRAVSVCMVNGQPLSVDKVTAESEIHSGIKDMYCPRLFGSAQPANGILGVEDEIRLNFNEPIAQGLLTKDNFQVRGVRNGTISDHSTSVRFDGINDYIDTEFSKNLKDKSLTVEMWIQPSRLQNATLFSHGNINESLELALTADECLTVKVGSTTVKSPKLGQTPANPNYADGSWAHVALVYNAAENNVSAYYNFDQVISSAPVAVPYTGIGNVVLGKSITSVEANYSGKMHNVRVWEKVVNSTHLQLNSLVQLAGIEEGLMAYYPMNEGRGTLCEDKARGATLTMQGTEWALPDGYAATTNGSGYLKLEASTAAFLKDMDFTIEFWFKAQTSQTNATILSAGSGEPGSSKPENGFAIGFDNNGQLAFTNNSVKTVVEGEYRDNNWHHFAFSVDRTKGKAQIYMDGNLANYIDAANVGGIASDFIYLGARGWYSSTNRPDSLRIDNHFKGMVDDVRFWELYKSEKMVRENNNVKLTGEELGLIHYYPFDTYITFQNQKYLDFTNKDMRISHTVNPETDQFSIVGMTDAAIRSNDIAPLKDFGPVADLDFDFVVNNDALIINLKEQEYKIAKTIVTFTVYDVRDLNGNSIVSPITWSAYIDRNQLRWETDRLDITKPEYEPYEFTVKAMNTGGAVCNYTINNIPSWLDVTPASGTLKPVSYDIITFSINEGLNVGTYNEVIYLTNEDNVSEPLALNITVAGEKPDWKVNPAEFKYNMSVFGKMRFNNIFSADKGDMLAAFDKNGNCIGVTTSVYNKTLDMWYALLVIYNNEKSAGDIEFRMWEAGTGKTYKATPSQTIIFVNDNIVGDVDEPVIFDGKEIFFHNIPLNSGWNWISFNLKDEKLSNIDKQLANAVWTKNDVVKNADDFSSYSAQNKKWEGTLNAFNNTSMYILHSSNKQSLNISGSAIDPKSAEGKISVQKGWNYIGYIPAVNMTVKEALAGYDAQKGDIVKSQTSFSMFSKNEWIGSLEYMEPGKGYMLMRTSDNAASFNYPVASAALSNNLRKAKESFVATQPYHSAFSNNMVIVATTTEGVEYGDRINAYINGELRGTGKYIATDNSEWSFITISGDEKDAEINFELERNGNVIGKANNLVTYQSNAVIGTVEEPLLLDFGTPENNVTVYPNPFREKLFVLIGSNKNGNVQLTLSDITGRKLLNESRTVESGANRLEINGSSLGTGIYILQVTTADGTTTTHKVEKE